MKNQDTNVSVILISHLYVPIPPHAHTDVCTINNLPPILNQSRTSTTSTMSFSAVITSYSLGCCGLISAWSALINKTTTRKSNELLTLNFQVWQPQNQQDSCGYRLIGSTNATCCTSTEKDNFILDVNNTENGIGFQIGDVIGISVQNRTTIANSVRLRTDINPSVIMLNQGSTHQQGECVGLTTTGITAVPIISAIIGEFYFRFSRQSCM